MTDRQEYMDQRWIALALLCIAQFVVVLDASIVNVALPTIGESLTFSQDNLSWVVNAYVLTFGGFLLLGGRLADLLGRRRVFIGGLILFAARLARRRLRRVRGHADRRSRGSGPRRRAALAGGAIDRHDDLLGRRRAQQGAGRLGRGRRIRWRRGRPARRDPHRVRRLGVGPVGQRADRDRRSGDRPAPDPREPCRPRDPLLRRPRAPSASRPVSRSSSTRWSRRRTRAGAPARRSGSSRSPPACSPRSSRSSCARSRR